MVPVDKKIGPKVNYRTMSILAVVVGGLGIALQLLPDGENLSFMLSAAALGGLIGGKKDYSERERQQLREGYKTAYEWLLLVIMAAYALILVSRWFNVMEGAATRLNDHWPSLVISLMCLLMGMAGFQKIRSESPA